MEVQFTNAARKDLKRLDRQVALCILKKLDQYAQDQDAFGNTVTALVGRNDLRLCIGNYRVLFFFEDDIVVVTRIGHRRDAYD